MFTLWFLYLFYSLIRQIHNGVITKDASPIVGHFGAKSVISPRHHLSKSPSYPPWVTSRAQGVVWPPRHFDWLVLVRNQMHFLTSFGCVWVWRGLWLSSILWFISFLALTWSVKDSAYKLWSSMTLLSSIHPWSLSFCLSAFNRSRLNCFPHDLSSDQTGSRLVRQCSGVSTIFSVYWSMKFESVKVMFITLLRDWVGGMYVYTCIIVYDI